MFSKKRSAVSVLLALAMAAVVAVTPALAIDAQALCEDEGGSWLGSSSTDGYCTYGTDAPNFYSWCEPADTSFVETYVGGSVQSGICSSDPVETSNTTVSTGTHNSNPSSEDGEPATLSLPAGKNGSVTFPAGTCGQKCTISSALPGPAKNSMPRGVIATLYVRMVDADGNPGTGSYTVCFENPDGESLTIYRYVSGVWTAIQIASSNPLCVSASGDGAFYLG